MRNDPLAKCARQFVGKNDEYKDMFEKGLAEKHCQDVDLKRKAPNGDINPRSSKRQKLNTGRAASKKAGSMRSKVASKRPTSRRSKAPTVRRTRKGFFG